MTTSSRPNLKSLDLPKDRYNRQAVEYLEELLEQAKSGEILEIVVCSKLKTGQYENCYTGCSDLHELVGQLERMKFLTLRRMDT